MIKYGELIKSEKPVLIYFFQGFNHAHDSLVEINESFKGNVKFIKIDADINADLCDALRIKNYPTVLVYVNSEMIYRNSGPVKKLELIGILEQNIKI